MFFESLNDMSPELQKEVIASLGKLGAALAISITDANEAPTVSLVNITTTMGEEIDTTARIKVADIVITDDALDGIAEQAMKRGTGARGLRAIMEEVLLDTMYELPSRTDVARVLIDGDVVRERVNPTLVPIQEVLSPDLPEERSA